MFSLRHELHELFPDTTFTIGMAHKLRGVMQHEISAPNFHLCRHILASFQSLHTINSGNHSAEPQLTLTSNEMFSTYIPTSLLNGVLLLMKSPTIPLDARTLTLKSIKSAFLDVDHINITTLSWLLQAYFGTHKHSPDAILDVVEVLLNTTLDLLKHIHQLSCFNAMLIYA